MRPYGSPRSCTAAVALLALLALGCNIEQNGEPPTSGTLNFPIAIALSNATPEGPRYLLVANSNFDLRFNSGSVLVLDTQLIRERIRQQCPGGEACEIPDIVPLMVPAADGGEVAIGSHANGIVFSPDGRRVYLPVRSEQNVTFLDFDPETGRLSCDAEQRGEEPIPRCAAAFRAGDQGGVASERELVLNDDPVALVSGRLSDVGATEPDAGDFLLLASRSGRVALFLEPEGHAGPPELVHIADGFPDSLVTMTMQPRSGVAWMTSAATDEMARVGISLDPTNRTRSFLFNAGNLRVGGIDDGEDLRDVQFDPRDPLGGAFVLSRRPDSVVSVDLRRRGLTSFDLGLRDVFEVGEGPSRLEVTTIGDRTYLLVSCFDAQKLFVVDADHGALVAVVGGFSGPFELAVASGTEDGADYNHLYVVDFATSVIRVVDLSPLTRSEPPVTLATLGVPFAPSGL